MPSTERGKVWGGSGLLQGRDGEKKGHVKFEVLRNHPSGAIRYIIYKYLGQDQNSNSD